MKLPFDGLLGEKVLDVGLTRSAPNAATAFLQELDSGSIPPDVESCCDRLIVERGFRDSDPLKYFADTYERARSSLSTTLGQKQPAFLNYVCEQCIAHAAICLAHPEMIPQTAANQSSPAQAIAVGMGSDLSPPFFRGVTEALHSMDPKSATTAMSKVLRCVMDNANKTRLVGDSHGPLRALNFVCKERAVVKLLYASPLWRMEPSPSQFASAPNPAAAAAQAASMLTGDVFQRQTFLGPFFSFSAIPDNEEGECETGAAYLREVVARHAAVDSELALLRQCNDAVVEGLKEALVNLLKSEEERENVLKWIADACEKNAARTQEGHGMFRMARTSSEGFVVNLFQVLVRLCKPFIDPSNDPKNLVGKIDPTFFLSKHRLDLSKETKLASTDEDVNRWVDPRNLARIKQFKAAEIERERKRREEDAAEATAAATASPSRAAATVGGGDVVMEDAVDENEELEVSEKFGTISEYFFLCLRCMHVLATDKMLKKLGQLNDNLRNLRAQKQHAEATMDSAGAATIENAMNIMFERKFCFDAVYEDPNFTGALLSFTRLVCVWLRRLANAPPSAMPLPLPPPKVFVAQPEHVVESVANVLLLITSTNPQACNTLMKDSLHDIAATLVALASSAAHVKNPYLRGKLIQILSYLIPQEGRFDDRIGFVGTLFSEHSVLIANLVPVLVRFYVDIEVTGSHSQFYDKFAYRHYVANLLRHLWTIKEHRLALRKEAGKDAFVRFVNMLINDMTWCIDESLSKLQEINQLESQKHTWGTLSEQERAEKKATLKQHKKMCRFTMQQGNEAIEMINYITTDIVDPFMAPELRDRLAATLNYVLVQIAGPKCTGLKISKPEKVQFRPKELLKRIVEIYIHLSKHAEFAGAVSRDGRSFDKKVFMKTGHILRREHILDAPSIDIFEGVATKAEEELRKDEDLSEILGTIPEEFLDPITCDLIRDPVLLPGKGDYIVDRSSIARHVLSDESNPFNREFLSSDMVKALETDQVLLDKINAFIAERKAAHAAKK